MKWMCNNLLKLNQDKTELVVKILNVRMGDEFIAPMSSACYPGVIMDNCFFMKKHVKKICNGANYHVRNILKNKQTFPQLHLQLLPPKYLTPCTINTGGSQRRFALKNIEKTFY